MVQPGPAVHRTILVVDVEGFSSRINPHQLAVRNGLYRALRAAFANSCLQWIDCHHEDRGDGTLILAPSDIAKSPFVESLPHQLVTALRQHNDTHRAEEHIRLRMALHAGEIHHDDHGVAGASINLAFRLLEASQLKSALASSPGVLALITSAWFYFPDGQLYVNLPGFDPTGTPMHPAEAVRGFLDAFQIPPERIPINLDAQAALYRSLLADRHVLVVLDNARDTNHIRPLLPGSFSCLVVVTSRQQLTSLSA